MYKTIYNKREKVIRPGGLRKRIFVYSCVSLIVSLCVLPTNSAVVTKSSNYSGAGGGVSSFQIRKLINEKKQKMAQLEQCAKKVNGFKIAGVSTLGLTAVGVGGNIALATKNAKLENTINGSNGLNSQINDEQNKIASLDTKIAAEEQRVKDERKKAEEEKAAKEAAERKAKEETERKAKEEAERKAKCDAQNKKWENGECNDNVEVVTSAVSETSAVVTPKSEVEENIEENTGTQKTSMEICLEERANMSAEAKACCYVSKSVAKWDGKQCKCNGDNEEFDVDKHLCIKKPKENTAKKENTVDNIGCIKKVREYLANDIIKSVKISGVFFCVNNQNDYKIIDPEGGWYRTLARYYSGEYFKNISDIPESVVNEGCAKTSNFNSIAERYIAYNNRLGEKETVSGYSLPRVFSSGKRIGFGAKEEDLKNGGFAKLCKDVGGKTEIVLLTCPTNTKKAIEIFCNCGDGNEKCKQIFLQK